MSDFNKIPESARSSMSIGVGILLGGNLTRWFGSNFTSVTAIVLLGYGLFYIIKLRTKK